MDCGTWFVLLLGISKVLQSGFILDKKRVRAKSELPCGTCSGPKVTTGRCMYNQRASPAPSSGSLKHPCSQDDQLGPRQKLHPPSSTWTNCKFTVSPKKELSFSFRSPSSTSPFQSLSREAKSLFCRSQGASAPNPLLTHTIARSELLD